ncbi:uncharacterized protein [Montipora capricornis]|uniref:uncharacterized protein n=1 Tax=Montipora capricornis TaxID=246305 RepID=UPI0035F12151
MAAPVQPNPDALAALAAPPAAPPVIPPTPAQPAPAADGGVAQAAQAAPVQQEEQAAPDAIADLKKELVLLRQKHDAGTVDSALGVLRQLLARPAAIFDPHASLAALEQLVDLAREKGDEIANRFGIVLRQTRTLLYNPSFQHLLLKLIGSKEEVEVAKEIQKALKQSPPTYLPGNSVNSGGPSRPFPRARQAQVCFSCGRRGHYARSCWAKRGPYYSVNRK